MSTTTKDLLQTLADGVEGFSKAAESVKDPGLKTLFSGFATERQEMAQELQEYANMEFRGGRHDHRRIAPGLDQFEGSSHRRG